MTSRKQAPSREEVLDAFALEPDHGRETLLRYLAAHAELADDLIDLARELAREIVEDDEPLSSRVHSLIQSAWQRLARTPRPVAVDPFAAFSGDGMKAIAASLGVPRQVLAALRERRVIATSIPTRFLGRLSEHLKLSLEHLSTALAGPPLVVSGRSYKSEAKPRSAPQVSFEQVLIDAGMPADKRAALLSNEA